MNERHLSLDDLFSGAVDSGVISVESSNLLSGNLGSIVIAGAAGKPMEEIMASDVTLVTVLLDSSASIGSRKLQKSVIDGYNMLLDAFEKSAESDDVLLSLWTFSHEQTLHHSYVPVDEAARLSKDSYRVSGATHLYDTWCDALASNIAYAQQLRDGGTPCRSIVIVITDGEDVGSKRRARQCAQLSAELLKSEQFVLAFVGVGRETNFRNVAKKMGVPENSIAVQKNATPSAMRDVFQMVSQSAIRISRARISPGPQVGFF